MARPEMRIPIFGNGECLAAQLTAMRPNTRIVRFHVAVEVADGAIAFQAQRTRVRFLTLRRELIDRIQTDDVPYRVNANMDLQVAGVGEPLLAVGTKRKAVSCHE